MIVKVVDGARYEGNDVGRKKTTESRIDQRSETLLKDEKKCKCSLVGPTTDGKPRVCEKEGKGCGPATVSYYLDRQLVLRLVSDNQLNY